MVLGASKLPERYAYIAVKRLKENGHKVYLFSNKTGEVLGEPVYNKWPVGLRIDTITVYLNPKHQAAYFKEIIALNPRRIILNPGSENNTLKKLAESNGIKVEYACTLVLLSTGVY